MTKQQLEIKETHHDDRAYAHAIHNADSFAGLIGVINQHGTIAGSQTKYSSEELCKRVGKIKALADEGYRATPGDFKIITRSLALRHKCKELYANHQQTTQ